MGMRSREWERRICSYGLKSLIATKALGPKFVSPEITQSMLASKNGHTIELWARLRDPTSMNKEEKNNQWLID